jgi:hypothetical protein
MFIISFGSDARLYLSHYTGARISRIEADGVDCIFADLKYQGGLRDSSSIMFDTRCAD